MPRPGPDTYPLGPAGGSALQEDMVPVKQTDPRGMHRPRGRGPLQDLSPSLWGGRPRGPAFSMWDGGPLVPTPGGVHPPARPDAGVPAGLCPPWDPQVTGPVVTCSWRPSVFSQSSHCGFSIRPENPHEAFTRIRGVRMHTQGMHTYREHTPAHTHTSVSQCSPDKQD